MFVSGIRVELELAENLVLLERVPTLDLWWDCTITFNLEFQEVEPLSNDDKWCN